MKKMLILSTAFIAFNSLSSFASSKYCNVYSSDINTMMTTRLSEKNVKMAKAVQYALKQQGFTLVLKRENASLEISSLEHRCNHDSGSIYGDVEICSTSLRLNVLETNESAEFTSDLADEIEALVSAIKQIPVCEER